MADISLQLMHQCGRKEAKQRLMSEMQKVAAQYNVSAAWEGDVCKLSGPVKGTVAITDDNVTVNLVLGFAAKIFRGKIQSKLEDALSKALV